MLMQQQQKLVHGCTYLLALQQLGLLIQLGHLHVLQCYQIIRVCNLGQQGLVIQLTLPVRTYSHDPCLHTPGMTQVYKAVRISRS